MRGGKPLIADLLAELAQDPTVASTMAFYSMSDFLLHRGCPRVRLGFRHLNSPRVGSFTPMRRPHAPPGLTPSPQALLPAQLAVGS